MYFAEEMYHVYKDYCRGKGWSVREVSFTVDQSNKRALKLGVLKVSGEGVYHQLKCESGVHK
jgi:protein subunit release factor A